MQTVYSGRDRRNRLTVIVVAVLAVTVILSLLGAGRATADVAAPVPLHAALQSVTPAAGARLGQPPAEVVLVFTEPVSGTFLQVSLTRAGVAAPTGRPVVTDATVRTPIQQPLPPGDYRVAFRVVSQDGHPVSGDSAFTVLPPATSSETPMGTSSVPPTPPSASAGAVPSGPSQPGGATPTYKTPQRQRTSFGHPDHRPGLLVAAGLLLGGVGLLLREQRRRHR